MSYLQKFIGLFRFHKLKMLLTVFFTLLFTLMIFPYNDLGDWVSMKVSEVTQNQVFVQFENMSLSLIPQPGLKLKDVYVESALGPQVNVGALAVSPSIRGLLTLKPGVSISAEDLFSGDVQVTTRGGQEAKGGNQKQIISLSTEDVLIEKIMELVKAPLTVNGKVDASSEVDLDPQFTEQPEGKINLTVKKFHLPASVAQTPFGPLNVPELKISKIQLKGRLKSGELFIDNLVVGNSKDELNGTIKGKVRLQLRKRGVQVTPIFGRYEFTTNLKTLPQLEKKAGLFLGFLDSYKTPDIGGNKYILKLSGSRFGPPPQIQNLGK